MNPAKIAESQNISINGIAITDKEISQEMQYHPSEDKGAAYATATRALIIRQALLQEAERLGFSNENVKMANDETAEEARIRLLIDHEVKVPVATEDACKQYYQSNQPRFLTTPLIEVSHILLSAHPKDDVARAETQSLAKNLIASLQKKPDSFKKMVKEYSVCSSKGVGGSLGQLSKGQTVPEFEKVVFNLAEGLSPYAVETRYGYHVVRVDRRVDGKQLEFDMVKEKIENYLNEKVERKALSQYIHILLGQADILGFDLDIDASPLLQ